MTCAAGRRACWWSTTTRSTGCCSRAASELQGHSVACGRETAASRWRCCGAKRFDLLLLDMEMPEMDGFQVLEQLVRTIGSCATCRSSSRRRWKASTNVVRCIELGAEDYLTKPVNPVLLKARIEREPREEASARPAEGADAPLRHAGSRAGPAEIPVSRWAASSCTPR